MPQFLSPGPLADRTGAAAAGLMLKLAAPPAVTGAPTESLSDAADLAANFADPFGRREYPLHSPAAAWASAAFYHAGGSDDPPAAERIKTACDRHRLFGEWDRLAAAARPAVKSAAAGSFALPAAGRFPLGTADRLRSAAAYFAEYADELQATDRREFAANVAKAAAEFPGVLGDDELSDLQAEGGMGRLSPGWKEAFDLRVKVARIKGLDDLAGSLEKAAAEPGDPVDAAAMLRRVDAAAGWELPDPMGVVVDLTPAKAAAEMADAVRAADGSWYRLGDLSAVPDAVLSAVFGGPPVASSAYRTGLLKEAATVDEFRRLLADHGVGPAAGPAKKRTDWAALAARS